MWADRFAGRAPDGDKLDVIRVRALDLALPYYLAMRHLLLPALVVCLALGAYLLYGTPSPSEAAQPETSPPAAEEPTEELPIAPAVGDSTAVPEAAPSDRLAVSPVEQAESADAIETCIVIGRLLDEEGAPLPGVTVQLMAYRGWPDDPNTKPFNASGSVRGYETTSDSSGDFRVEAPLPRVAPCILKILPDRFRDSMSLYFDSSRSRYLPSLLAGERDLGELSLASTGALQGRVTNERGELLEGVEMSVGTGRSSTFSRNATTAADGTFVLGHAPIGTYALKANIDGYLSGYLEPVTVQANRDTLGMDFVLLDAPTIEGRVVDEFGIGIEGVQFWGWPKSSGMGAGGKSVADGRFVIPLPQDEPYSMSAKCEGYESWGDGNRSTSYAPGTRDLDVVMHSLSSTRILVRDGESEELIERFGLHILENNGSKSEITGYTERRAPRIEDHPGGWAEVTARAGVDLYVISADGYLLATGDVAPDAEGSTSQTVLLQRGASMRGRVLDGDGPVAGARVEVQKVSGYFNGRMTLGRESQSASTDDAGEFVVGTLEPGKYRVKVQPPSGAALAVIPDSLAPHEERDLGDLLLLPGARIDGVVRVPVGIEAAGLEVQLGLRGDQRTTLVDVAGRFEFGDVASGPQELTLLGRPGELGDCDPLSITLESGEARTVTLDASDRAMCSLTLRIEIAGGSAKGVSVYVAPTADPSSSVVLGQCDDAGRVSGTARAWGETLVRIHRRGIGFVEHPEARLNLVAGVETVATITFEFSSLSIGIPDDVQFPEDGYVRVRMRASGSEDSQNNTLVRFKDGIPTKQSSESFKFENGRLWFGWQTPIAREIELELAESPAQDMDKPSSNGEQTTYLFQDDEIFLERSPYFSRKRTVVFVAGEQLDWDPQ